MLLIRRRLLAAALAAPLAPSWAQSRALTCGERTPRQTEGPFFKTDTPQRRSLIEPTSKAQRLVLAGTVLSAQCRPVANALLDFWHADEAGEYDNRGFRYRGHQLSDAQGRYGLETVLPGEYPGRARHIHVKVQAPGRSVLTTQLYFANDAGNARDRLYRPELVMRSAGGGEAQFDFVVEA